MPDLRDRFHSLDGLKFPEIEPDLESREPRPPIDFGQSRLHRAGIALVALAVGAAGVAFAVRAFEGGRPSGHAQTQGSQSLSPTIPMGGKVAIATYSYGDKPSSIYLMNEDGSDLTFLVEGRDPAFSPDGTRIAFRTGDPNQPGGLETRINIIDVDGTGMEAYQPVKDGEASGESGPPVWSPDGSLIAFDTLGGIYVMRPDGTDVREVTHYEGPLACYDLEPSWSPDGTQLVFAALCDGGNDGVWSVNLDGSGKTQILAAGDEGIVDARQPAWSPNGSRIAFSGTIRKGDTFTSFLYTMTAGGHDVTRLTDGAGSFRNPSWSPDGALISYTHDSSTGVQIVLMNSDGSNPHRLSTDGIQACCLAWQPSS